MKVPPKQVNAQHAFFTMKWDKPRKVLIRNLAPVPRVDG